MKRIHLVTLLTALTVTFAALVSPLPEQSVFSSRVRQASTTKPVVTIPFKLVTRHIVVPVKVNNSRPLSFVFDTGDKVGIVDIGRAKELGLDLHGQVRIGGAGSDTLLGSYVRGATWKLQGLEDFSQPVALAIPLGRLAARFGHDFDGIIGSDFIKQFVIEVDYQACVLRLHAKDKFVYSGSGESLPIQFNSQGHPLIDAEVTPRGGQPIKGKFLLDLGSSAALALHSPLVKEHRLLESSHHTIRAIGVGGAGGESLARLGRVSELKISKFKIPRPTALFSQDKAGALSTDAGITAAREALTGRKLDQRSLNCVRRGKTLPVITVGTFAFDWGCRFEGVFAKSRYFKTDEDQTWKDALDLLGWQTANTPQREELALAWVRESWFAFVSVLTEKNQDFQDHPFQPPSVMTNQDGEVIVTLWTNPPRRGRVRGRSYLLREIKFSHTGAFLSMTTKTNFTAVKDDGG